MFKCPVSGKNNMETNGFDNFDENHVLGKFSTEKSIQKFYSSGKI